MADKKDALGEVVEKKMYLSLEDAKNIRDFYEHFEVPVTDLLKSALENFEKEQTYENQEALKLATVLSVSESQHEVFVDEMFVNIRKDTADIAYEMTFERDMQEMLRKKEEGETAPSTTEEK